MSVLLESKEDKIKEAKKKCTPKEIKFVDKFVETWNATQAILSAYDANYNSARSMGSENLAKPNIKALIEAMAEWAMSRIEELSVNAKNESVKLQANKDILDRAWYKPTDKTEVSWNLWITEIKMTEAQKKIIAKQIIDRNK